MFRKTVLELNAFKEYKLIFKFKGVSIIRVLTPFHLLPCHCSPYEQCLLSFCLDYLYVVSKPTSYYKIEMIVINGTKVPFCSTSIR